MKTASFSCISLSKLYLFLQVSLQETVKELQNENKSLIKREVISFKFTQEIGILNILGSLCRCPSKFLLKFHILSQASLEETIKQLQYDNNSYIQKEVL